VISLKRAERLETISRLQDAIIFLKHGIKLTHTENKDEEMNNAIAALQGLIHKVRDFK
jgi:hypothetical protein